MLSISHRYILYIYQLQNSENYIAFKKNSSFNLELYGTSIRVKM